MKVGLAYTLKSDAVESGRPDDWQEEFDSPATIQAIQRAIESHGHTVALIGDGRTMIQKLLADPPDLVFNIAEGRGTYRSREAWVPAVCELLGIPCTGSDPLTCAATLDKDVARRLVASADVKVPRGFEVPCDLALSTLWKGAKWRSDLMQGYIVKPAWEGSSKGIRGKCLVHSDAELVKVIERLRKDYQQPLLVEEFIAGHELTVGVLGNNPPKVLGIMRVVPKDTKKPNSQFIYSLEVKRDWENQVRYECPPAGYDAETLAAIESAALTAYSALGCRDVARIDFRLRDRVPYFLEVNPLPGLNPETGDLVIIAKSMGVSHTELIGRILSAATERQVRSPIPSP
jgi:D-alanine-D-alanine ligase